MRGTSLLLFAIAALACSGGGAGDTVTQAAASASHDPAAVQRSIDSALTRFADGMKRKDTVAMLSVYTPDAVVMPNGAPIARGHAGISQFNAGLFSMFTVTDAGMKSNDLVISGDYAIESGVYHMTMQPKTGRAIADTGKYIAIWQRQADGSWKMTKDIFNSDLHQ